MASNFGDGQWYAKTTGAKRLVAIIEERISGAATQIQAKKILYKYV